MVSIRTNRTMPRKKTVSFYVGEDIDAFFNSFSVNKSKFADRVLRKEMKRLMNSVR